MEKFYIVKNDVYKKALDRDREMSKERNAFIKGFFERNGIEGTSYILHGNGRVNVPFQDMDKCDIRLAIEDTERNREKFGSQFKKSRLEEMRDFRKNSELLKMLQDECIQNNVIINLYETRTGDYFKGLEMGGYTHQRFLLDGDLYLKVDTDKYRGQDFSPKSEGFQEIKASEFYLAKERFESAE